MSSRNKAKCGGSNLPVRRQGIQYGVRDRANVTGGDIEAEFRKHGRIALRGKFVLAPLTQFLVQLTLTRARRRAAAFLYLKMVGLFIVRAVGALGWSYPASPGFRTLEQ